MPAIGSGLPPAVPRVAQQAVPGVPLAEVVVACHAAARAGRLFDAFAADPGYPANVATLAALVARFAGAGCDGSAAGAFRAVLRFPGWVLKFPLLDAPGVRGLGRDEARFARGGPADLRARLPETLPLAHGFQLQRRLVTDPADPRWPSEPEPLVWALDHAFGAHDVTDVKPENVGVDPARPGHLLVLDWASAAANDAAIRAVERAVARARVGR